MHLYILTRGIKHAVDQFITELQGKYLPIYCKLPTEPVPSLKYVQVAVRPIQLWEVVFPEEHRDLMLRTCLNEDFGGQPRRKGQSKFIWALRKMLGKDVEAIPDHSTFSGANFMPIFKECVEVLGIGIKKDGKIENENTQIERL